MILESASISKIEDENIKKIFDAYPQNLRNKLFKLRSIIIRTAIESDEINDLVETLKWSEPSYLAKNGSTVRLGIKKSDLMQYGIYFHCKTKLVDTFKELYGDLFKYEGNRAIIFDENDIVPKEALSHCIFLSLHYKKLKDLPLLGAQPKV